RRRHDACDRIVRLSRRRQSPSRLGRRSVHPGPCRPLEAASVAGTYAIIAGSGWTAEFTLLRRDPEVFANGGDLVSTWVAKQLRCMPRSSHLVNPLEIYSRQRRQLRSSRLTPAGPCSRSAHGPDPIPQG